jgi:hypothetical protein
MRKLEKTPKYKVSKTTEKQTLPIEKTLFKQRFVNLFAGQGGYVEKQKKAIVN